MNHLVVVLGIVFFSMLVQSTFSFGGALIALPLLAFIVEVKVATPLITLLSCSIAVIIVAKKWRDIHVRHAWRLIVSACLGIPLGILFLGYVDGRIVKLVLAITVITFTLINLFTIKKMQITSLNAAFFFGFISGVFGGAYNISGPPVVLYGTLSQWSPDVFRATLQSYGLVTNIFAILGYYLAGNLTREVVTSYVYALPVVGIAIWLGNIIHQVIPGETYTKYVKILLLLLGLNLLFSLIR
jgi:uncharacterized membrane protein YfcA